jgi:RNA polymerase sigma-70 factor (ECF subfamily)
MALQTQTFSSKPQAEADPLEAQRDLNAESKFGEDPDLALVRRFAGCNDADAFAQIVQKYAAAVYATCLRIIGDSARAEDASQETFYRLMRQPHNISRCLGAWLHRTATHISLDIVRSESSRKKREIAYTSQPNREASSWAELSPSVDQAISELPEELRVLLVQHYLLGKSQAELAQISGQSPATISRRVKQGLEELRQRLRLKGVYALPVALAGLLCHVAARQAPASLMLELGKMAMLSGTGATGFHAPAKLVQPSLHTVASNAIQSKVFLAFLAMVIGVLILLDIILGGFKIFRALPPAGPESRVLDSRVNANW